MQQIKVTPYGDRNRSKKEQVREMFDTIAHRYDFLNHLLSLGIDRSWRKRAVKTLIAAQPKRILDVATGTGDFAVECLKLQPDKIVGLDLSDAMMAFGREKAAKLKEENRLEFVVGDSEQLNYPDNYFDAITVGFGVRNFEHLEQGLREMRRVLRPGGRVAILEITQPRRFPFRQFYALYFKGILPLIGRIFSKDSRAYSYLPESVSVFPEGEQFTGILTKCGFTEARWESLTFGTCALYTCTK
jgi:demethylmenaquinone methyltransferase/2-methoxy-6-polyprenyl-1,4-benzoquinol methylase